MSIDLSKLLTERRNANSANIDTLSTLEMLTVINREDQQVARAITPYLPQIAEVVDKVAAALQAGGRLIYIGAGTSGRLGILDASECPPTFGTRPEQVVGIIAGGHKAILSAVENVEDNKAQGAMDLQNLNFSNRDVLVGLAASGRTPYVIGAMEYAHSQNAFVAIVSCNPHGEMAQLADVAITRWSAGSGHWLYPPESRHRAEAGAEHDLHRGDDPRRQGVQQPDGRRRSDQRQAD